MTTTPTDRTTAFEPTQALDALPEPADGQRHAAADRPPPGRYLVIERDGGRELRPLTGGITHIGRSFAADVQLEEIGVSRRHAIVTERREAVRILDDRSSNGTFVNGNRIEEAELHDGDVIVIGGVVLQYVEVADG